MNSPQGAPGRGIMQPSLHILGEYLLYTVYYVLPILTILKGHLGHCELGARIINNVV